MFVLAGDKAAQLIRAVVAGRLSEAEFASAWPEDASSAPDFVNSRTNVMALFELRRAGDVQLAGLLEEDLADSARALEEGRRLEWFELEPKWAKAANRVAFAVGGVGFAVAWALGWPWWTRTAPLMVAFGIVWFAEWLWERAADREGRLDR